MPGKEQEQSLATGLEQKETELKHLETWDLRKRGLAMHNALLAFSYVLINLLFSLVDQSCLTLL